MKKHYVDNKKFYEAFVERRKLIDEAETKGEPKPRLSNYIGECILKISTGLSYKPNFIGYTYREEMVGDGIEACIRYIDSFNPEKSNNPFSYFTQVCYFAFIRRLNKEKQQRDVKGKAIHTMAIDEFSVMDHDSDENFQNSYLEFMRENTEYDPQAEKTKSKAKKPKAKTPLEELMGEDIDEE